jgi:hypothetical protein
MSLFFVTFWTVMLFLSIAWYAALIFLIGIKAGREIKQMTEALKKAGQDQNPK